jgi:hypothetical protein
MNYTYSHIEETERYMIMCAYETGQSLRKLRVIFIVHQAQYRESLNATKNRGVMMR